MDIRPGEVVYSDFIEISVSSDKRQAFVLINKAVAGKMVITKNHLMDALNQYGIIFGIMESKIEKLVKRPVYNLRIEVAVAGNPVTGADGWIKLFVKKDLEYQPVYGEEGQVDYKNLNYLQLVEKGQVLCEIYKETDGIPGKNVFGELIPAARGKKPRIPAGKNTSVNADGTQLLANCTGTIKFLNDIHICEHLNIPGNVDFSTGNIDFPGNVTISGDIPSGFAVKSGGNLVVKGVVEDAKIEAAGNVSIGQGICSSGFAEISVQKNLSCRYIENAYVDVGGDLIADYIINGQITCKGNIRLAGNRETIIGGEINLYGDLLAKEVGNDKDCLTIIRVHKKRITDQNEMNRLIEKKAEINCLIREAQDKEKKITKLLLAQERLDILNRNRDNKAMRDIFQFKKEVDRQLLDLRSELNEIEKLSQGNEENGRDDYCGTVSVKRKLYFGTRIFFGDIPFSFQLDALDKCKIYWDGDHIENNTTGCSY